MKKLYVGMQRVELMQFPMAFMCNVFSQFICLASTFWLIEIDQVLFSIVFWNRLEIFLKISFLELTEGWEAGAWPNNFIH